MKPVLLVLTVLGLLVSISGTHALFSSTDGWCTSGESGAQCALSNSCGNGVCEYNENPQTCSQDCTQCDYNTICAITENDQTCADCFAGTCSSDTTCDSFENFYICYSQASSVTYANVCKCKGDYCSLPRAFAECPGQCRDVFSVEESYVHTTFLDDAQATTPELLFYWDGARFRYEDEYVFESYPATIPLSPYSNWAVLNGRLSVRVPSFRNGFSFVVSIGSVNIESSQQYRIGLCDGTNDASCDSCMTGKHVHVTRAGETVMCQSFNQDKGNTIILDITQPVRAGVDTVVYFIPQQNSNLVPGDSVVFTDLRVGLGSADISTVKYLSTPVKWAFGIKGAEVIGDKNTCEFNTLENTCGGGNVNCACNFYSATPLPAYLCNYLETTHALVSRTTEKDFTYLDYAGSISSIYASFGNLENTPDYAWWFDSATITITELPFDAKIFESTHLGSVGVIRTSDIAPIMATDKRSFTIPGSKQPISQIATALPPESNCVNGVDDDKDGLIDCADPNCGGASCGTGAICSSVQGVCTEQICYDGVDNDGTGGTDCSDSDCYDDVCVEGKTLYRCNENQQCVFSTQKGGGAGSE
ncbi:hypothetical protein COT72_03285 [archaeon CG10_big_fil_rev_8_21_14_0_10_43_11]|nr:MAG: hypothetical protein COT72_03285 [archaeon CG10_big_fil_rev_8_21_14_0_10_43_11]